MMDVPRRRNSLPYAIAVWGGGRLVSGLLLVLAVWAILSMRQSPTWRVQWATVSGTDLIAPEAVVQASSVGDAWSVSLVPEDVAWRVRQLPGVLDAQCRVTWPAKVALDIREDVPLASVTLGDTLYWVTQESGVMEPFGQRDGLPALRLIGTASDLSVITPRVLAGLEAMCAQFPDAAEYVYHAVTGYEIRGAGDYPVYLGDASDLPQRLNILKAVEEELGRQQRAPQFIDISNIDGAYYR